MTDGDVEAVLRLNEDSVWALSPLDEAALREHRKNAEWTMVCQLEGQVAAFTIAYAPGTSYGSVNYCWHCAHFDDFVYLDRIAVDPEFRRRGIARAIYDVVEDAARPHGRMVCEVNSEPPNVESLAFHQSRGYREVGRLRQPDGHQVVLLEKPL